MLFSSSAVLDNTALKRASKTGLINVSLMLIQGCRVTLSNVCTREVHNGCSATEALLLHGCNLLSHSLQPGLQHRKHSQSGLDSKTTTMTKDFSINSNPNLRPMTPFQTEYEICSLHEEES